VQGFLISLFAQDPAELLARFKRPVLILQGRRDLQVAAADAERLAAARPGTTLVMLDEVNHALKRVASDDRAANLATYADQNLPLAPGVVEAIARFLAEHPPAP
jgi:pimeloyl-ACP methyl ester carboxylesterase